MSTSPTSGAQPPRGTRGSSLGSSAPLGETWVESDRDARGSAQPVQQLGRYELIEGVGLGGMGEVYRAYDPELDREIAVKRLSVGVNDAEAASRLLREAQAIARLNHPHVVQVFDAGRDPRTDDFFIAMELVEGTTLRAWLRHERSWREIAGIFLQAGEGLAAAHAQGFVHRDFKPENVLVTPEGHAKVVDFGLAKPAVPPTSTEARPPAETGTDTEGELRTTTLEDRPSSEEPPPRGPVAAAKLRRTGTPMASALTPAGARLGTPAYMPPEQHMSRGADPRADQFSFAVALYEALQGRLPFEGRTPTEYSMAVLEGKIIPFSRGCPVPRRLQLAVERALSTDPERRFATLAPLLAELRRDPVARRRRTVTLALAVGTGGVFAVGVAELARPGTPATSPHCDEVARAADDVWTTERRQQVSDALRSTSLKFAADTADRVVLALDDLVLTWKAARRTACLDTAADSQEAQLEVARRLCLDRNLARQRDLVEALADPSTSMVRHVSGATEQVSRELSRCSDAAYLWQIAATAQSEPGQQTRAAALLGRARRHLDLGQLREGLAVLNEELTVDELARWPAPAVFEWGMIRAGLERGQGDFLRSRQTLEEAAHMTLGRAAPIAAADWQVDYGDILFELDALEQGDRAYARAEAFLNSRLGPDAIDTIVAAGARGHLPFARGDYGRALEIYEAAALVASRVAPETDGRRLELDRWTSETLARVGRLPESLQRTEDIVRRLRETRGDKHPSTLEALETLAGIELRAGHSDTALQHLYEVLEGLDASEGAQHSLARATTLANVGAALTQLERLDEATRAFEEARDALRRGGLQRDHAKMLAIDANLAAILNQQGRYQEALAVLEQVSEQMHAADTAKTTNGLMVRFNHAAALLHLARWAEAVAILESALGDAEIVGDSMVAGRIQLRLAQAYDRLGRGGDAERALMAAEGALADQPDEVLWVGELKAYRETRRFAARPR